MYFVGVEVFSSLFLLTAIGTFAGPVVATGGMSVLECLAGVLEAFIEGIVSFFLQFQKR